MRGAALSEPRLAARLAAAPVAASFTIAARVRALRAAGVEVLSLTLGEPDFASPPHAVAAAHAAALRGETRYPPVEGTPALKAAIAAKFARDHGWSVPAANILVGNGARQIIFDALFATLDPGDEVIIPAPWWNAYPLATRLAGATPVFVDCPAADGFLPDPDAIGRAITPRTRWLVLNFPNNPSGAVCPADRLAAIAAIVRRHRQLWVMADDLYESLIHDGTPHATLAAVAPDLAERVLTVGGVSKTYAMTGWRVGYATGPARLIAAMANIQGQATGGVSPVAQAAAAAALDGPTDGVAAMRAAYAERAALVAARLAAGPGLTCHAPGGAFYVFPGLTGCLGRRSAGGRALDSDTDFAAALLDEQRVAGVPGSAFGMSPYLRLSVAADTATLAEACRRLESVCAGIS